MNATPRPHRAGFVALLGKPNAGKSTLLNALLGEKVAAVSARPQTTQRRMAGIVTREHGQIILVDLPGIVMPDDPLRTCLRDNLEAGLKGVDVVIHIIDAGDRFPLDPEVAEVLATVKAPIVLAVNKLDGANRKLDAAKVVAKLKEPFDPKRYRNIVGMSALEKRGTEALADLVEGMLPESPQLYGEDEIVESTMRELATEMIREKVFEVLRDELPYAVAVTIDDFIENPPPRKWVVRATLHVERDSQKSILIGSGGDVMKKISTAARLEIERLCGHGVFLELWVKVRKNWRKNARDLGYFGVAQAKTKKR